MATGVAAGALSCGTPCQPSQGEVTEGLGHSRVFGVAAGVSKPSGDAETLGWVGLGGDGGDGDGVRGERRRVDAGILDESRGS